MTDDIGRLAGSRVVITGVAGFIGSQLAEAAIERGAEVVGIDWAPPVGRTANENLSRLLRLDSFRLIAADVCDPIAMADAVVDARYLVHLAGIPGVRGSGPQYWTVNHDGTVVTIKAAIDSGVERIVVASSSSVYGPSREPLLESSALVPRTDYARSKAAAERAAAELCSGRSDLVVLRYFTVFGPRQRPDMLCSRLLTSALGGPPVDIYGDGSQTRPFTFVGDAVAGSLAALTTEAAVGPYNIGGSRSVSVREMVDLVGECAGVAPTVVHREPRAADPAHVAVDISRAERDLGYVPAVGPREGIRRQCEHLLAGARGLVR